MNKSLRVIEVIRDGDTSNFKARVRMTINGKNTFKNVKVGDTVFSMPIIAIELTTSARETGLVGMVAGEMSKNNNFVCYEGRTIEFDRRGTGFSEV